MSSDDPAAIERVEWAQRGAAWDRQADRMAALAARLNQPLIEAADLHPGQAVLDLASGAGEPALTIAALVAPDGRVTATDLVEEMLTGARRRAAAAGLATIAFKIADMAALPFADASFDRITCRFGLMFAPDTEGALREAWRVLRPGGRAVWMVWGPIAENTIFLTIDRTLKAMLGTSFLDREINPFRFAAAGHLTLGLRDAGFTEAQEIDRIFTPKVEAGTPFWRPTLDLMLGHELESLPPAQRRALDQAIGDNFAPYLDGTHYRLKTHVRLYVGGKRG